MSKTLHQLSKILVMDQIHKILVMDQIQIPQVVLSRMTRAKTESLLGGMNQLIWMMARDTRCQYGQKVTVKNRHSTIFRKKTENDKNDENFKGNFRL